MSTDSIACYIYSMSLSSISVSHAPSSSICIDVTHKLQLYIALFPDHIPLCFLDYILGPLNPPPPNKKKVGEGLLGLRDTE